MTIQLNDDQREAASRIEDWLKDPSQQVFRLGGLAGTGKTTLVGALINKIVAHGIDVKVATPTGKASVVLNRKFGRDIATTIHRLAYSFVQEVPTKRRDADGDIIMEPEFLEASFGAGLLILDESSMVGRETFDHLQSQAGKILCVGDHGQLSPVKAKPSFTEDKLDFALSRIERQQGDSPIIDFAYELRNDRSMTDKYDGIGRMHLKDIASIVATMIEHGGDMLIVSTNKIRNEVNRCYREQLGFPESTLYTPGERVLVTRTHYPFDVFNGEVWEVKRTHDRDDEGVWADLVDPRDDSILRRDVYLSTNNKSEAAELKRSVLCEPGYGLTAWKAQGSEAPKVGVISTPITWLPKADQRAYNYTAATRAADALCIFTMDRL